MNVHGILREHWLHVAYHFVVDAIIFAVSFVICSVIVEEPWLLQGKLLGYFPGVVLGAFALPCMIYIFGLYSPLSYKQKLLSRAVIIACCLAATALVVMALCKRRLKSAALGGRKVR